MKIVLSLSSQWNYSHSIRNHFLFVLSFNILLCVSNSDNRFQGTLKGRPTWTLPEAPKIAIIGAGVGGSGVAYFLSELLGDNVKVDLYEKSDIVGGRLHTVEVFGRHYETGGSIIHPRNKYAVDLTEKLGLRKKEKEPSSEFGLLKDQQLVFSSSSWKFVTILRILYRYGFDFNYIHSFTNKLIDDFSKMYTLQEQQISFEHPFELLSSASPGLANLTRSTFKAFLQSSGFKDIFIDELVSAITYVNYGQDTSLHSLVGSIAVAGAAEGLWSIENGNKQLPIALSSNSKAKLILNSQIQSIKDNRNGSYGLSIKTTTAFTKDANSSASGSATEEKVVNYDIVVIANPLEVSKIQFLGFENLPYDVDERKYHQTVATIVAGILQENFTASSSHLDSLFTCDGATFFTTVGRIYPVDSDSQSDSKSSSSHGSEKKEKYPVYKIFSPKRLTEDQLNVIFSKIYKIDVFPWMAYPHYNNNGGGADLPSFGSLPSFLLDEWNLFYLNAIEWGASAIEMSLLAAKNIALIVAQRIGESQNGDINQNYGRNTNKPNIESTRKIEL